MNKILSTLALASQVLLCLSCSSRTSIGEEEYMDKLRGGWAGKIIGVQFGQPHEFHHLGNINEGVLEWEPGFVEGALGQDDIYTQLSFMKTLEHHGLDASSDLLAEAFAGAGFDLFHANLQARKNWRDGLRPPMTGSAQYNIHADDIDFQIDADFIGFMCPGMPGLVRSYCDRIGPIMNDGDGIYGGVFIATMHSLAFFSDDILDIVEGALRNIPSESAYARCVSDVVACYKADSSDWKAAWKTVQEKWGNHICHPNHPFDIDAKINGAYVVIGLLYGGGDFRKTMEISIRCGQDADCNSSNAAAVWGIMHGYDAIPEEFRQGLGTISGKKFAYTDYSWEEAVDCTAGFARENILSSGGRVRDGKWTIRLQKPQFTGKCRQSFPEMRYVRSVYTTDVSWHFEGAWDSFVEWNQVNEPVIETVEAGASAEISFEGGMVSLIGGWDTDCGKADVYIDGVLVRRIDSYFAYRCGFMPINRNALFLVSGLGPGPHTLKIVNTGDRNPESSGNRLMFNRLDIYDMPSPQER